MDVTEDISHVDKKTLAIIQINSITWLFIIIIFFLQYMLCIDTFLWKSCEQCYNMLVWECYASFNRSQHGTHTQENVFMSSR